MTRYSVVLLAQDTGIPLAWWDTYERLEYVRQVNGVGAFVLELAGQVALPYHWLDSRVVVLREAEGRLARRDFVGFLRSYGVAWKDGKVIHTLAGPDYNDLLRRRIIAYPAGSSQADKTGAADDVCKALVRENLGVLAGPGRDVSAAGFSVLADRGQGTFVSKAGSRRVLLDVLQEIADASKGVPETAVDFGVIPVGNWGHAMQFATSVPFWGRERRAGRARDAVLFSPQLGNLDEPERTTNRTDEVTFVYGGGTGTEEDRLVVSVADAARVGASVLNRREGFFDGRNYEDAAMLLRASGEKLAEGRPVDLLSMQIAGPVAALDYGAVWDLGDAVSADVLGLVDCQVTRVHVAVTDQGEAVTAEVRVL